MKEKEVALRFALETRNKESEQVAKFENYRPAVEKLCSVCEHSCKQSKI